MGNEVDKTPSYDDLKGQIIIMARQITGLESTVKAYQEHLEQVVSANAVEDYRRIIKKEAN